MKSKVIYISILVILLLIYIAIEINRPRPVNWELNFSEDSKIPYGCYILKDILVRSKSEVKFRDNIATLYESLNDTNRRKENFIVITNAFNPDLSDISQLLKYVERGNTVFISALNFSKQFSDTLKFTTDIVVKFPGLKTTTNWQFNFTNPELSSHKNGYLYKRLKDLSYFSSFDTLNSIVLGQDKGKLTHFIKVRCGKGFFYLHTMPLIFTNYFILYDNKEFPFKTLSYLTENTIVWDEFYKPGISRATVKNTSPLRYVLSQVPLRTSYYLLLITIFLYMVYEGKRRQRVIPIHKRPKNSSKEFLEIVSQLYLNRRDNKNLAEKKIIYFYDHIASVYYLKPDENDPKFQQQFAEKSGMTQEKVKQLCNAIRQIRSKDHISDADLAGFVKLLNKVQYKDFKDNKQ